MRYKIPDDAKSNFRNKMNKIINENGIVKQELCRKVGITPTALYFYETGQRFPSPEILIKLAIALGMNESDLEDIVVFYNHHEEYFGRAKKYLDYSLPQKTETRDTKIDVAKKAFTKSMASDFFYYLYELMHYDKNAHISQAITLPNGFSEIMTNEDYLGYLLMKLQKSLLNFKDKYDLKILDAEKNNKMNSENATIIKHQNEQNEQDK